MTYASPAVCTATRGAPSGRAAMAPASAARSTAAGTPSPWSAWGRAPGVTTSRAPESASMKRSRWAGYPGSSGRKAPPALSTARMATTVSGRRSATTATTVSGRTPRAARWCASRLAARSSSR